MPTSKFQILAALALLGLAAGCQRETISSYQVPKEDYSVAAGATPLPHLHWELPKGWEEREGDAMSVGRFLIAGEDGKVAEVRIVPLQGVGATTEIFDKILQLWKTELRLPAASEPKVESAEVGGLSARVYEFASTEPTYQGKFKQRTVAALLPRKNVLWSVKLSGEDATVAAQQAAFRDFLKSLEFHDQSHDAPAAEAKASVPTRWKAPETWTEEPPGQMVLAAYTAKSNSGSATITVTSFPGDVGGMLANVNRWRRQIQLTEIQESELKNITKEVTLSDGTKATDVRLKGPSSTLMGLIVPRGGQTWFYKMTGDDAAVNAQAGRLLEFAAIAK